MKYENREKINKDKTKKGKEGEEEHKNDLCPLNGFKASNKDK